MTYRFVRIGTFMLLVVCALATYGCGGLFGDGQLDNDPPNTLVNECFVFDCNSGAFGGMIQWCTNNYRAFDDCP